MNPWLISFPYVTPACSTLGRLLYLELGDNELPAVPPSVAGLRRLETVGAACGAEGRVGPGAGRKGW